MRRDGLVARLADPDLSMVFVGAPAGYGKTTLLAQYAAAAAGGPVAWVSLDQADDDPVVLVMALVTALERVAPVDPRILRSLAGSRQALEQVVLPRLVNALAAIPGISLLLDDLHLVHEPASLAVVAFLAEHVPISARLLVASRDVSFLPLGRMRVRGGLLEITEVDLALERPEVAALLEAAGVGLDDGMLEAVVERTEGWPAALSLVVPSLSARSANCSDIADLLAGDDRDIVDYFASELLSRESPDRLSFLLRTSILERLSAPLCDAVLERGDSASVIAGLEREHLFLLPLDHTRRWYRYHHLFRDVLRAKLVQSDGERISSLHLRAAKWYDRHGTPEEAFQHAIAGGDMVQATDLVVRHSRPLMNTGRLFTARRWLDSFSDEDVADSAPLALAGAAVVGLFGEKERARRYFAFAERAPWWGVGFMGETSRESALALLKALFGWEGVTRMRAHALVAYDLEPLGSPAHEPAALALGSSLLLLGRSHDAVPLLEEAAGLGSERASGALVALGELAQIALDGGVLDEAEAQSQRGLALIDRLALEEQTFSASVHAATACLGARRGDARAREHLDMALPLLVGLSAWPWLSIQTRTFLGRAALEIGDTDLAARLLEQARRELAQLPDAGVLSRRLAQEEHRLEDIRGGGGVLAESLTNAERRVLDVLPTHLSVCEIAEGLHISASTVKSHQKAIYRKLGVARRSDAVAAALRLGLLTR